LLHSSLAVLDQVAPESGSRTPVLFHYTLLTRGWPTGVRYLATLLIVSTMLALGLALDEHFHGFPFLLFSFAILISSALFDRGSGAFSVLLSGFFAKWFFIAPTGTIRVENTGDLIALSCFMALGLAIAAVVEALHRVASDLVEANQKLTASENEKNLLLEEASHRFRNELTMLGAMLRLQERTLGSPAEGAALRSAADRVHVLGRVHERLQGANHRPVVNMGEFLSALCDDLRSARIGLRPISLKVHVEPHVLSQKRAVPVGLLLNELLTNTIKYAFPDDRKGAVAVHFLKSEETFVLKVRDDGVGMSSPPKDDYRDTGFGQRLLRSMVAQLEGSLEFEHGGTGTAAVIRFPA
jgi:two-component system, sensor histidine kinase PdtaS